MRDSVRKDRCPRVANLLVEITPQVLLKAYACGIFPMAESADDPALYWVEPEQRGVIPLDGLSRVAAAGPHRAVGPLRDRGRPRFRGGDRWLRRARRRAARTTWINARIRRLYGELFDARPLPHGRGLSRTASSSAASTASISARRSSAKACSTARAMPRRSALRASGGAAAPWRLSPARHAVRHRSPGDASAPSRCRASSYHVLLERALAAEGDFLAWPRERVISGAEALTALEQA